MREHLRGVSMLLSYTCTLTYINPSISTCEWNLQEHAGKQSGNSCLLHFCKLQDKFQKKQIKDVTTRGSKGTINAQASHLKWGKG